MGAKEAYIKVCSVVVGECSHVVTVNLLLWVFAQ